MLRKEQLHKAGESLAQTRRPLSTLGTLPFSEPVQSAALWTAVSLMRGCLQ